MPDQELRTAVWLLIGMTGSTPGVLELAGGQIAFTTAEGRVFQSPLADISVKYPWYYFGGGCKITIGDKTHRISFVRPNNAMDLSDGMLAGQGDTGVGGALALLTAGQKFSDVGKGRKAGKIWKAALASRL
jgi:hypothetical protein